MLEATKPAMEGHFPPSRVGGFREDPCHNSSHGNGLVTYVICGTAAQNTAATAVDFPVVTQNLQPMNVFVRYHFAPDWAVTMRYQGELYSQSNYETATLVPATGKFFFLANNFQNYNARYFTFSFSYRPGLFRRGRSTL